jgi:lysophospholipase L1-like esterase
VRVWQAVLEPVRHVLGEVVDLLPVLDTGHERQEGGHWLYTRDNHPDERGYRRIGRHLAEVVAARLR